jgi:hypothetical protein
MKIFAIVAGLLLVTGCTDTQQAHWGAIGSAARVTCYSGGKVILDDFSTGKVGKNGNGGDGYEFKSATTGRLQQANGDCVVDYGAKPGGDFHAVLP